VNGAATLEGHVEWQYQKNTAESKLRGLEGVRCVVNNIVPEPQSAPVEIRHKIEEELGKAAEVEASRTRAEPADREAGSRGTLRSWAEHRETERYALPASRLTKAEDRF
jgi:osmotically-inducible protein OsmY